jgi:FkbM family methyltransferase
MKSFRFIDILYIPLRLRKIIVGKDFLRIAINNYKLKKYGNKGAEWVVVPSLNSTSVVYSFGVGNDISFDLGLIKDFGVKIYAFDPTPKTAKWLNEQSLPSEFIFEPIGLAAFDGEIKFFLPENPNHVSASIVSKKNEGNYFNAPVNTLKTIMGKNKHNKIDILKMDIEGAEYDVVDNILQSGIEITQILIEFHHRFKEIGNSKTINTINKLKAAGYKTIFINQQSGEEYTFIKQ